MPPRQPHPQRISPKASKDDAQAPKVVLRALSGQKRSCSCSCRSPWPSVALRVLCGQKVLQLPFFAVLRGPSRKKEAAVAVAVLRGPPWPSVSSVDKRCCSCRSSRSFAVLRGPSWKKEVAVTVLRHPPRTKQNKHQHTQRLQKAYPGFPALAVLVTITTNVYPF